MTLFHGGLIVIAALHLFLLVVWLERRENRAQRTILGDLLFHASAMGLELVKRHPKELKRGTVYITLNNLEDKGWVESAEVPGSEVPGGIPRRKYWLSDDGRQEALKLAKSAA